MDREAVENLIGVAINTLDSQLQLHFQQQAQQQLTAWRAHQTFHDELAEQLQTEQSFNRDAMATMGSQVQDLTVLLQQFSKNQTILL